MRNSQEISAKLESLRDKVKPLMDEIGGLERDLRYAKSHEWIAANNVKREDIVTPDDEGLPYFGHIKAFSEYMVRTGNTKKWCVWNGTIYNASEIMMGFMDSTNSHGQFDHVPGAKP